VTLLRSFICSGNTGADQLRCADVKCIDVEEEVVLDEVCVVVAAVAAAAAEEEEDTVDVTGAAVVVVDDNDDGDDGWIVFERDVNQPAAVVETTLPKLRGAGGGLDELIVGGCESCLSVRWARWMDGWMERYYRYY
jgi:ribosomal protein L14